ncbi:class I SAM-dependent methyltransferase [Hydrogenimonas thermophila]|uniref:Methyltransferase domain-containing protein n=1 Tax=Hydrogenimonas thermophila TaxID=223786 RepID=A0A1I5MTZ4_9BACT|nr:class I SAM-dependent methyltransferase [Hydrogenimonas thermophila]SFP12501.1 Methyltransferase domain-containing protein [Hydrogenimonas thermophila]
MNTTLNYYKNNSKILVNRYESANVSSVQSLLLQTFREKNKLLEIGCGSGRDASFMFKNGFDVIAIDGSENMITEAKKTHPEISNFLYTKVLPHELEFKTKFDGIYSIATLMHLSFEDLKLTLLKIFNLLNIDGKFLISVSLFRDDIDKNGFDDKGRFFLVLPQNKWIELCEEAGFKIENIQTNNDGLNRSGIEWLTLVMSK